MLGVSKKAVRLEWREKVEGCQNQWSVGHGYRARSHKAQGKERGFALNVKVRHWEGLTRGLT